MKHSLVTYFLLLPMILLLSGLPGSAKAGEETLLILTTSDTRSELAPCG